MVVAVLNVAEKPSVARSLAGVFARMPGSNDRGMQRREGAQVFTHDNVQFPNIFAQGQGVRINGPMAPHTMITTSVRGHLASQDFPPEYGWSFCDPIVLFEAPIATIYRDDVVPLERNLRALSRQVTAVILWLDCDREGEAIGKEVQDVCLASNPRLQVYRARFSTVLPQEIQQALHSLGRLNLHWVAAVETRSELDLRVGAAFTRFQTLRLKRKFDGMDSVLSYGPCQFPTLGFVVERWARIETFVPEKFWYIELSLRVDANTATTGGPESKDYSTNRQIHFTWKRGRLYDRLLTLILYESCLEGIPAVVKSLEGRSKNKWRPVPLNTVELQKRASRYLRIGSETLMGAAEELYQQGYISYPRTETERFSREFAHRPLIQQFVNVQEFGDYANKLLNDGGFQLPRAGQHDDQAHPPITPCKAVDPNTIGDLTQRKIYTLVVKHYLACCSRDAVGKETSLTLQVASEEFVAKGLMILERNWLEIYQPWERWSTGQGELPHLQVGSRVTPSSLLMKEGTSTPPQPLSEVELISLMDRNGIGTDATIAQHITTIQERKYAIKDANQNFLPTPLGIALVAGYNSMGYQLNKPDLRRETEAECNHIAAGQKTKELVLTALLAKMRECFVVATRDARKLDEAVARHFSRLGASADSQVLQARFSLCGECRNVMALKQERGRDNPRKLVYCQTCRSGYNLPSRGQIQAKLEDGVAVTCPICNFQVVQIVRGNGYDGNGYHVCPKCFSDSPQDFGGSTGDFRCFTCQHPTCSLASGTPGDTPSVFGCPFCNHQHQVCLRKNSRGFVLSCNKYIPGQERCSYTIWLPKETQAVTIPDQDDQNSICTRCSSNGRIVRKTHFVWKPGSVPPHLGREVTTCVLCDVDLRREMSISLPQLNQVQARPVVPHARASQGRGSTRGGGRTGNGSGTTTARRTRVDGGGRGRGPERRQNNGGGGECYRCGQPGHYANNCPSTARSR